MLPITDDSIRLFLHVLGATVWLGGQIVLAGLVPVLRRASTPDVVRAVARQFQRLAWPAFALLLATGVWNLLALDVSKESTEYQVTLLVKLACVALSGIGAGLHALLTGPAVRTAASEAEQRRRRALSGATAASGLLFSLLAAYLGVLLNG